MELREHILRYALDDLLERHKHVCDERLLR